jgi:hypothetical protein
MATKKPAAKAAKTKAPTSTRTSGVATRVVPESGNPKDTKRPEIDESRHADSGLQELTTTGAGAESGPGASSNAAQGSGLVPSFIDPQPSIGADHGQRDHQDASVDVSKLERVTNYPQAAALPVIEKGAKGYSTTPNAGRPAKKAKPGEDQEADVLESFKDKDRRTMIVIKTADGFAACPKDAA